MAERNTLSAQELHILWERVDEGRKLAFLSTLTEPAADQLLAFQRAAHEQATGAPARQSSGRLFQPTTDPALQRRREANREHVAQHRARKAAGD